MIRPPKLKKNDKVATISLSWGGAGAFPARYQAGKEQLQKAFELEVVETKHALHSADWIYKNPQARADDLMEALIDPSIKAIFSNIGGDDSIRTLPYIDLEVIRQNPKIFLGFSDSTVTHFCFYKAGVTSFYGTSVLIGFAENNGMHSYQIKDVRQTLFSDQAAGLIQPNSNGWTSEKSDWEMLENQNKSRKLQPNSGWRFLQGNGIIEGPLLGGCVEVLEILKGTDYWVKPEDWKDKIMFLETSEEMMPPNTFKHIMRNYAATGIFKNIAGLILARPYQDKYWEEYDQTLLTIIREEEGLEELPIITGMDFGHTCPIFTLPFGMNARINCTEQSFSILENGVS